MPRYLIFLLLTAFVAVSLPAQSAEPALLAEDYARPGEIMPVAVSGRGIDDVSIALIDTRGRAVSRASGFPRTLGGEALAIALLGVPSTADPGRYRLSVTARQGRSDLR